MIYVDQNATWCQAPRVEWVLLGQRGGGAGRYVQVESVQQVVGALLMVDK